MHQQNQLVQQQKQILSSDQIQALQILELSNVNLYTYMMQMYEENPIFVYAEEPVDDASSSTPSDFDGIGRSSASVGDPAEWDFPGSMHTPLSEYLLEQLCPDQLSSLQQHIFLDMIDRLEPSTGRLAQTAEELAAACGYPLSDILVCIRTLQSLEPAGIGAYSLQGCLIEQLRRRGIQDEILFHLITDHLDDIAHARYHRIVNRLGLTPARLSEYLTEIRSLDPRPTAPFTDNDVPFIVPDVAAVPTVSGWKIDVNDGWTRRFSVHQDYASLRHSADKDVRQFFVSQYQQAGLILNCIAKRRQTLFSVCQYMLSIQRNHILFGAPLKTLTHAQAAQHIGVQPSTVSRAVRDKYIQLPSGVFALRVFFTRAATVHTSRAASSSSHEITSAIQSLIAGESPAAPLSDEALAAALSSEGIAISRRTVAKYRLQSGIPGKHERCSRKPGRP